MDRINGAGYIDLGGGKRGFADENLGVGSEGTEVTALWLNAVQEELLAVIEAGGLAASEVTFNQLLRVLRGGKLNYSNFTGTATALTITLPGLVAYADGMPLSGRIPSVTDAPLTVNVNGLGAVPVTIAAGVGVPSGLFSAGDVARLVYVDGEFRVQSASPVATLAETIAGVRNDRFVSPLGLRGLLSNIFQSTPLTLYVRSDGDDTHDGSANTAAKAFKTLQAAINYGFSNFGTSRKYIIQIGLAGTYAAPTSFPNQSDITFIGDPAAPQNYIIASGSNQNCFLAGASSITLNGLTCRSDNNSAELIKTFAGGYIAANNVRFTSTVAPYACIRSTGGGYITLGGTIGFATSADVCIDAILGGLVAFLSTAVVSYSGAPSFGTGNIVARDSSTIWAQISAFSGSATGPRFYVNNNSLIQTAGGGINLFPGSVAGTQVNGGLYV